MEINELKQNVAQNIYFLRTANNMTQSELGAKINYSDKAISKWERAEGLPDVFVLAKLGELFGVNVDYLLNEHTEQDRRVVDTLPIRNTKRLINLTVLSAIMAVAVLLVVTLYLTLDIVCWQIFIYSLPVIFTVQIVFSAVWWHGKGAFVCTSLLCWSVLLIVYVALFTGNMWQLFIIGIPVQLIVLLCYHMRNAIRIAKKTSAFLKRRGDKNGEKLQKAQERAENEN